MQMTPSLEPTARYARAAAGLALLLLACAGSWALARPSPQPMAPWFDPLRTLSLDWRLPWILALPVVVATARVALTARGAIRHLPRVIATLAMAPLLAYLFLPTHFEAHQLGPAPAGHATMPAVVNGELTDLEWTRRIATARPLTSMEELYDSERSLARVAHGIVENRQAIQHENGEIEPQEAQRRSRWRSVLWTSYTLALPVYLGSRVLVVALGLVLLVSLVRPRPPPGWLRRLVIAPVWILALAPATANLTFLALGHCLGLPELEGVSGTQALHAGLGLLAGLAAVGAGRLLSPRPGGDGKARGIWGGGAALGSLLLMATACGPPSPHDGPPGPPPDRPPISHAEVPTTTLPPQLTAGEQQADIVILLLEGQWNDSRDDQTPEDGLVQGLERRPSLRFEAAYSQSSRPFPSTVSMLTGLYPSTVPVCAMPLARPGEEPELPWCASIPEGRHTLPQLLAMYGYRTALVHGRVRGGAKLAALFQHGELVPPHRPQATRKRTALWEASLHWWEARAGSPRLLVVADSVLPESIRRASRNPIAPMSSSPALLPDGVAPDPNDLPFDPAALTAEFHLAMVELGQELRPWLERLLTTQERPCWVVITSPAGIDVTAPHPVRPSLGKNPLIQESTVHVPLLVFHSSDWALEHPVERLVELVDLFPSLSSLGGAPPPAGIQGENLFVLSPAADPMAQAYMEHGDMLYLRRGSHLYGMRAMVHFTSALDPQVTNVLAASGPSGPQLHLYDVVADPLQATDLVQQDPTLAREMYELLLATRRAATAPDVQKLEPEQLWELRMSPQQGYW